MLFFVLEIINIISIIINIIIYISGHLTILFNSFQLYSRQKLFSYFHNES